MSDLTVEIRNILNPVSRDEWTRLFLKSPNTFETIELLQRSGIEQFKFHSILVRKGGTPALLLPLFETDHYLGATAEGQVRKLADGLDRLLPGLLHLKLLRIGIVDQQWGEVGWDRELERKDLSRAWDFAIDALEHFSNAHKIQLIAFTEFTSESGSMLPLDKLADYHITDSAPFIQIPVALSSVEDYLMSLPRDMRHFLRRSQRKAKNVRTVRTREPEPWLDAIYNLYLGQVARSELNLNGTQQREYFANACRIDPAAEYFLYLLEDTLIGFELVSHLPGCLLSKFVAIDPALGRENNLYFRSWMDLVTAAIETGVAVIDLGCTGEELKTKLGDAIVIPSFVMFKHRNPLMNKLLKHFKDELKYDSKIPVPAGAIGLGWQADAERAGSKQVGCIEPDKSLVEAQIPSGKV